MPGKLIQNQSEIVIQGIPTFSYRHERDSFILALRAAAAALGREIPYYLLKGHSAAAFRLMFHHDWQRYTPDAFCGYNHAPLAFNALGLQYAALETHPNDPQEKAQATIKVIDTLQTGFPLLGLHVMTWEDWGVITGYSTNKQKLLCRSPHVSTPEYTENLNWPWLILAITGESRIPNPKQLALQSLQVAVELFDTENYGAYFSGQAAYDYWAAGLLDEEWYQQAGEPQTALYSTWANHLFEQEEAQRSQDLCYLSPYLERLHVNHWRLISLIDARREAARYLFEISSLFPRTKAAKLDAAGHLFGQIHAILEQTKRYARSEWDFSSHPWTQADRDQQAKLLAFVAETEMQAIELFRQVIN